MPGGLFLASNTAHILFLFRFIMMLLDDGFIIFFCMPPRRLPMPEPLVLALTPSAGTPPWAKAGPASGKARQATAAIFKKRIDLSSETACCVQNVTIADPGQHFVVSLRFAVLEGYEGAAKSRREEPNRPSQMAITLKSVSENLGVTATVHQIPVPRSLYGFGSILPSP